MNLNFFEITKVFRHSLLKNRHKLHKESFDPFLIASLKSAQKIHEKDVFTRWKIQIWFSIMKKKHKHSISFPLDYLCFIRSPPFSKKKFCNLMYREGFSAFSDYKFVFCTENTWKTCIHTTNDSIWNYKHGFSKLDSISATSPKFNLKRYYISSESFDEFSDDSQVI